MEREDEPYGHNGVPGRAEEAFRGQPVFGEGLRREWGGEPDGCGDRGGISGACAENRLSRAFGDAAGLPEQEDSVPGGGHRGAGA